MKLQISQPARDDLVDIWEFIAEHDELAADRYIERLRLRARELMRYPHLGRVRREIHPGIRSLLFRNHLIFYRVKKASIQILRILHGSMDLPNQDFPA
ncbi:MAG: type II toxin-antitoxin system RelE/ParE family toxin [Verrucomicrobiota bacterium]